MNSTTRVSTQIPPLVIAGVQLRSRLFLGTGKYGSPEIMAASIAAADAELVTVALRRVRTDGAPDDLLAHIDRSRNRLLPNTSGVRNAREALLAAELAREALETNWLKLEIHPDPKYLMPDALETLAATRELVRRGFVVLPYIHADPVVCKQLEEAGAAAVMPLAAPIGTTRGLEARAFLEIIIAQTNIPVVVDAGLGAPSHAAAALELGADAVLVNTAIATAPDPVAMGHAFRLAVEAGAHARFSGLPAPASTTEPRASSPLTAFLTEEEKIGLSKPTTEDTGPHGFHG
jgi:thiazole synthase